MGYSREVLECILAITNLVYDSQVLSPDPALHYRRVTEVERRLRLYQRGEGEMGTGQEDGRDFEEPVVTRLYQMAALIYLTRIGHEDSTEFQSTFHTAAVNNGLALLARVDVREVPWPLFVIGCEAATDVQRKQVLQLLSADSVDADEPTPRRLMEAFWIQDDLDTTRELTYVKKMSGVISALPSLPSFG
ncbi:hypothetical protein LTR37_007702 [Vermiconidia calcicola]|uniref:Uncharacterized protein n=1 Tax=Vermiconidia calcicola TaxID=1690605 RepID=A0ACC3NDB9_9PEZI|nr:hypothetical protein LTR37_007702 [Vermiconidia calcicola]